MRKQSTTRRLNFIDKKRVQTVTAPERCGIIKLVESTIYRWPANCDEHPSGQ